MSHSWQAKRKIQPYSTRQATNRAQDLTVEEAQYSATPAASRPVVMPSSHAAESQSGLQRPATNPEDPLHRTGRQLADQIAAGKSQATQPIPLYPDRQSPRQPAQPRHPRPAPATDHRNAMQNGGATAYEQHDLNHFQPQQRPALRHAPQPASRQNAAQPVRRPSVARPENVHPLNPPARPVATQVHPSQVRPSPHSPVEHPTLPQTELQNREDREDKRLTFILMVGLLVIVLGAVIGIAGLVLNQSDFGGVRITSAPQDAPAGPLTSPSPNNASSQQVAKLVIQNNDLQRQLATLKQEKTEIALELAQIKSLYSQLRIAHSWHLSQVEQQNSPDLFIAYPAMAYLPGFDQPIGHASIEETFVKRQPLDTGPNQAREATTPAAPSIGTPVTTTDLPRSRPEKVKEEIKLASLTDGGLSDGGQTNGDLAGSGVKNLIADNAGNADNKLATLARLPLPRPHAPKTDSASAPAKKLASIAPLPPLEQSLDDLSGNTARFLTKMQALRQGRLNKPLTILHIGDSHIASDSFTRGIRKRLQALYGDAGRGAVIPARAYKYAYADGVSLVAGKGWSAANSLRTQSGPYGLSGVRVSTSATGAKMTLKSKKGAFDWAEVTVFTGPKQGRVEVITDAGSKTLSARSASTGSKTIRVEGRSSTVVIKHRGGGKTTVLNWSTGKNRPGIRYVNFGISGATAAVTKRWSDRLLHNDVARIKPDLIVYGYGTNEGYNDNLKASSYRALAENFVAKLQRAAPQAAMMFIGPADGARRRASNIACGGGWYTPKKLGTVRGVLKSMAQKHNALFWDWASAMGGRCGAAKWSLASPRLVAGDRVHLTPKGYDKSAGAFVNFLDRQVKNSLKIASN